MTNTTRKHPRTMQEAFGPYTTNDLQPMRQAGEPRERFWQDLALVVSTVIGLLVIFYAI